MIEIKHLSSEIIYEKRRSIFYLDQLSDETLYIQCLRFSKYLMSTYKLSVREYYSLVVFNDKDYIPKCRCSKNLNFIGLLKGYGKFCSNTCHIQDQHADPIFREANKKRASNNITIYNNKPEIKLKHSQQMSVRNKDQTFIDTLIKKKKEKLLLDHTLLNSQQYSYFISRSIKSNNIDECIFYISLCENTFKIGIAQTIIHAKQRIGKAKGHKAYQFMSTNINVADHELQIKNNFKHINEIIDIKFLEDVLSITRTNTSLNEIC